MKYDGAAARPSEVADDLCSVSMLGGRRVVLVLGATFLSGKRDQAELVDQLAELWEQGREDESTRKAVVLFSEAGLSLADIAKGTKGALDEINKVLGTTIARGDRIDRWRAAIHARLERDRREIPPASGGIPLLTSALASGRASANTLVITARKVERTHPVVREIKQQGAVLSLDVAPGKEGDRQMAGVLDRLLATTGLRIQSDARAALLDRVPPDPERLAREVEKLALYVGDSRTIDAEAVGALVARDREDPIFLLQGSLGDRNVADALARVRALLAGGDGDSVGAVLRILAAIASETRRLLRARLLIDGPLASRLQRSTSSREFESRIFPGLSELPGAGSLASGHPFRCYRTFQGAFRYHASELVRMLRGLAALDRALKSTPGDATLLLERFLVDAMSRPVRGPGRTADAP
ncbi:MAG: hypothetical protein IPK07_35755 [Deltaproteobacteria bacterium]|nr:hypothetical protein [Deltaproteobacteria bacterium]